MSRVRRFVLFLFCPLCWQTKREACERLMVAATACLLVALCLCPRAARAEPAADSACAAVYAAAADGEYALAVDLWAARDAADRHAALGRAVLLERISAEVGDREGLDRYCAEGTVARVKVLAALARQRRDEAQRQADLQRRRDLEARVPEDSQALDALLNLKSTGK